MLAVVHPPLAHVLSGGGPLNVVLLLLGLCVGLVGIGVRNRRPTAAGWGRMLTVVGVALFGLGLVVDASPSSTASNAIVDIVEPRPGQEVPAGRSVEVVVELENAAIALSPSDTSGGHLHLYVDGQLQQMPYSLDARVTLDQGRHELRVEYVDFRHVSFSPEVTTTVEVTAT
jgi:hypothetical protein